MRLRNDLNIWGMTMIVIGSCIGSGIFLTPGEGMAAVGHHGWLLMIWAVGGVLAYFGAMVFSELGVRYPQSGGVYIYLKEAYGDIFGFLYGWIILFIVNTGALAGLSIGLTNYIEFFIPLSSVAKKLLPIGVIVALTFINVLGVNISQMFAGIFTSIKLIAIFLIIVVGFYYWPSLDIPNTFALNEDVPDNLMSGILLGFVGVFWSFGGWHHATYLAGEAKNPQKTVPRAMLLGTMTVTLVYLLAIFAYMKLLPAVEIAASSKIAGDAVENVIAGGGKLVTLAIAISIFGTIGIYTMTAPRIYHAMAEDGLFFKGLSKLHPKYKTPYVAMIMQMFWACFLVLIFGTFVTLITFVTFMDIVFMALATASIFVFRHRARSDDQDIPYKLKAYPLIPILYLMVTVAFVINTLISLPAASWAGVFILLLGLPAYAYFKKNSKK